MKLLRAGICVLLAFSVLTHGAVEEWAMAVLEIGAALLFLYWAALLVRGRQVEIVLPAVFFPVLLFVLLSAAQLLFRSTLYFYATRVELQLAASYLLLLFLAAQAYRTLPDWRGFVWFLISLGFLVSIFAILQHLTFNGKLYWFREMRFGGIPFGPYVNRNHFAGLVELLIPVGMVPLVLGKVQRERLAIVVLFALLPIGALFLSASRGGIIAFLVEMSLLALLVILRKGSGRRALVGGSVLLLALLLVSWLGVQPTLDRFAAMKPLEASKDKRVAMAKDAWRIFLDHRLAGTGLGTLQSVFPAYDSLYDGKIVNHAHNDFAEVLAETGILGALCCSFFLFLLFSLGFRHSWRPENGASGALQSGAFLGCIGFLVHCTVDFNLHIPSNALLFFLLSLLATSRIYRAPSVSHTGTS
ncbi:MAG: O-antigen ligase family protein [Acidobacteriia bacterium]|nr:O-antigen ligase family protein [Terriglobia bacterium]